MNASGSARSFGSDFKQLSFYEMVGGNDKESKEAQIRR